VILKDESLAPGFNADALAALTEGYSGSDLRNLCVAAAHRPIRDFLAAEKKARAAATAAGAAAEPGAAATAGSAAAAPEPAPAALRPPADADFVAAMKQVGPSVHEGGGGMEELRAWNAQYGEGGGRRDRGALSYYM